MPYYVRTGFPSLTPAYGLGSYGRTGAALLISAPRNTIGSQGRIYSYMKNQGKGPEYINFLRGVLGTPNVNPWTGF